MQNLKETNLSFLPITEPFLHEFYEKQKNSLWFTYELMSEIETDKEHFNNISKTSPELKKLITTILSFFAQLDGLVSQNLGCNFIQDFGYIKAASNFFAAQNFNEVIHNETYSFFIDNLIENSKEKDTLFNSSLNFNYIHRILSWIKTYTDESVYTSHKRLVAFICLEGILFNAGFVIINWIKINKGLYPALTKANEWILKDETLHMNFGIALFNHVKAIENVSFSDFRNIVEECIVSSINFIKECLPNPMFDLSQDNIIKYLEYVANYISINCGYGELLYEDITENPCTWMELVSLPNKVNFHERSNTDYSKPMKDNCVINFNVLDENEELWR